MTRQRALTPEQEAEICAWAAKARSLSEWARKLGVSPMTISNAIARAPAGRRATRIANRQEQHCEHKRAHSGTDTSAP